MSLQSTPSSEMLVVQQALIQGMTCMWQGAQEQRLGSCETQPHTQRTHVSVMSSPS